MFTASNITPAENIQTELWEIQQFLEEPFVSDKPTACKERLVILSQHMARSGVLKAHAEWHYSNMYNGAVMSAIKQLAEVNMSTSTINKYIESLCKDFKVLVTMSDRTNRATVHASDSIRTIISFAKQERFYQ